MGFWSRLLGRTEYDQTVIDFQHTVENGGPFRMTVADVFTITGRGTVVTGTIESGTVSVGDSVVVGAVPATVVAVEMFMKTVNVGSAGDNVGLLVDGVDRSTVSRGTIITAH